MRDIYILSVGYPFGKSEPFLQDEIEYHKDVVFVSSYMGDIEHAGTRWPKDTNNKLIFSNAPFFKGNKVILYFNAIRSVFTPIFWKEIISKDIRPINIKKIIQLLSCISKARQIVKLVSENIEIKSEKPIFYSYWMNQLALAGVMLAKKYDGIAVTRCHGYDLYKRAENNQYVTLQRYLLKTLDYVYPISQDGMNLLKSLYDNEEINKKVLVARLGTKDYGLGPVEKATNYFTIVSCSNVVPLKRVELILKAISKVKNVPIRWIHFGDGPLYDNLKTQAAEVAENSIHEIFIKGYTPKNEIMKFYAENPVDLFINVSESEGIPVSIMEALSFGIPCLGTNVGGMHEIINSQDGWLVDPNIDETKLSNLITDIGEMDKNVLRQKRAYARTFWEENYSADINYRRFIKELTSK